jgi:squalene-associated FAD-dependent desaturase
MSPPMAGYRPPHLAIVGGGLAGLAVAASMVDRGVRVTLFESRPRLGGRASSFQDPASGEMVDNCQHVSMACCTNLADFCRKVEVDHLFRRVPDVRFLSPEGKLSSLVAGKLPAPFHLTGSFLKANYLTWLERLRVAYGVACLASSKADRPGETVEAWLRRHGQTTRTIERYWGTVLVSALNERLDQMDLGHARKVFLDGFLRNRDGYQMEIPLAPLGEIYGSRLEQWLASQEVEVRLTTGVRSVEVDDEGHLVGIRLRSAEFVEADFVVLAAPFDRVAGLLPPLVLDRIPGLAGLADIKSSPITGVHLWFDRPVCPYEHVVTVGRLVQWVFDHSAIQGRSTPDGRGQYLQVVISASYDLLAMDKTQILDAVLADLASIWPASKDAKLTRFWVVTEHGATFAVRPGIDALRPSQRTPIEGLFLAGDWTATGWPATMEGAVRSGYLAAEGICEDLGRPEDLVRPGLPTGRLARWLLGSGLPPRRVPTVLLDDVDSFGDPKGLTADEPTSLGH